MKPIVLLGEHWGVEEARLQTPFIGASGIELIRQLAEAGIIHLTPVDKSHMSAYYATSDPKRIDRIWRAHPEVYRTNVFNIHPPRNDLAHFCGTKAEALPGYPMLIKGKFVHYQYQIQLDRLCNELLALDPNLIVCLGNSALWALAGRTGITKLRGTTLASTHTVAGFKLLPTYHPAAVLRQYELRPTAIADLMKAKRESAHAEIIRPAREIWIEPDLESIHRFIREHVTGCELLSVDIETSGSRVTCLGFAPTQATAIVIPFDDERQASGNYWGTPALERECWDIVRSVLEDGSIPKLFQNGVYDIAFLLRAYGIRVMGARHDTMLLSHALQPESLKGLGYLGSIYSDEGSWKHMRKKDETIKRDA